MANLIITINADCIEHAQELLAVRSMPATLPAPEATNELLADLKAARFALRDEQQAREDLYQDLQKANASIYDLQETARNLGATLDAIATAAKFTGELSGIVEHVRRIAHMNEGQAVVIVSLEAEVKRLSDLAGIPAEQRAVRYAGSTSGVVACSVPEEAPAETPASSPEKPARRRKKAETAADAPEEQPTQQAIHEGAAHQGPLEAGKYTSPNPAAPPEARAVTGALAELEAMPEATLTPGEDVVVLFEERLAPASIVRRFEGTDRYEVQILEEGRGLHVAPAEHIRKAPRPTLAEEVLPELTTPEEVVASAGEALAEVAAQVLVDEPDLRITVDPAPADPDRLVTKEEREALGAFAGEKGVIPARITALIQANFKRPDGEPKERSVELTVGELEALRKLIEAEAAASIF